MQNFPLISVSLPVYNSQDFIAESIRSILAQTYSNFELLILDDGSTDSTREIILGFKDFRIKTFFFDVNKGLVAARNKIAEHARGQYIALCDADDVSSPDRFEKQVAFLQQNNVDICGSAYWSLNLSTLAIKRSKQLYSNSDLKALLVVSSPFCNPTIMGRAEVFKKIPYLSSASHAEDYAFFVEAALHGFFFANLRDRLVTYRIHSQQISRLQAAKAKEVFNGMQIYYLQGLGISPEFLPRTLGWRIRLKIGYQFLCLLNNKIQGLSYSANYQLYGRYQFRRCGLWTPLIRLERVCLAFWATIYGFFATW